MGRNRRTAAMTFDSLGRCYCLGGRVGTTLRGGNRVVKGGE